MIMEALHTLLFVARMATACLAIERDMHSTETGN